MRTILLATAALLIAVPATSAQDIDCTSASAFERQQCKQRQQQRLQLHKRGKPHPDDYRLPQGGTIHFPPLRG